MARQRCSAEQFVNKLREAEVLIAQGWNVKPVCRLLEEVNRESKPFAFE